MSASDRYIKQQQYLEQLKAELRQVQNELKARQQKLVEQQQRNQTLRQDFARQFGHELLALIEGDPRATIFRNNVGHLH